MARKYTISPGIELSPVELAALEGVGSVGAPTLRAALDPRLQKAALVVQDSGE